MESRIPSLIGTRIVAALRRKRCLEAGLRVAGLSPLEIARFSDAYNAAEKITSFLKSSSRREPKLKLDIEELMNELEKRESSTAAEAVGPSRGASSRVDTSEEEIEVEGSDEEAEKAWDSDGSFDPHKPQKKEAKVWGRKRTRRTGETNIEPLAKKKKPHEEAYQIRLPTPVQNRDESARILQPIPEGQSNPLGRVTSSWEFLSDGIPAEEPPREDVTQVRSGEVGHFLADYHKNPLDVPNSGLASEDVPPSSSFVVEKGDFYRLGFGLYEVEERFNECGEMRGEPPSPPPPPPLSQRQPQPEAESEESEYREEEFEGYSAPPPAKIRKYPEKLEITELYEEVLDPDTGKMTTKEALARKKLRRNQL